MHQAATLQYSRQLQLRQRHNALSLREGLQRNGQHALDRLDQDVRHAEGAPRRRDRFARREVQIVSAYRIVRGGCTERAVAAAGHQNRGPRALAPSLLQRIYVAQVLRARWRRRQRASDEGRRSGQRRDRGRAREAAGEAAEERHSDQGDGRGAVHRDGGLGGGRVANL